MTWAPLTDNNGNIRGIKDAATGQRIVRWDGIADPLTDWGQANARLVLAAPEMLEAAQTIPPEKLELLADWIDLQFPNDKDPEVQNDLRAMATKVREAIKKARGEK